MFIDLLYFVIWLTGENRMARVLKKEEAKALIERLPENATWEDLMYEIYVREAVESGLEDSRAGRLTDVDEVRREFGLSD